MLKMEFNQYGHKEDAESEKRLIPLIIGVVVIIVGAVYFYLLENSPTMFSNHDFSFKSAKGVEFNIEANKSHIKIAELKGKIVFLKVFSWDCQYCKKEIPELKKLKNRFKTAFDTIAIEIGHHSDSENLNFIDKLKINYNIVNGDKEKGFLDYLKSEYNWNGVIPLTVVLNANGKILAFEVGYKSYSLTTLLQTTLKELTTVAVSQKGDE
jgi:peroxiredoxin